MPANAAYLERCIREFLTAMQEADSLVDAGRTGTELSDVLHFASDLLDIITSELRGVGIQGVTGPDLTALRDKLDEARALLRPGTLH